MVGPTSKNLLFLWIDFRFIITGKTTTLLRVVSNHTTVLLLLHGCSGVFSGGSPTCIISVYQVIVFQRVGNRPLCAPQLSRCCFVLFCGVLVFLLADTLTHILSFLS